MLTIDQAVDTVVMAIRCPVDTQTVHERLMAIIDDWHDHKAPIRASAYLATIIASRYEKTTPAVLEAMRSLLKSKQQSYGNSATNPIRKFSNATTEEGLEVRMDDKLSRLMQGHEADTEDAYVDLLGYLILYIMVTHGH